MKRAFIAVLLAILVVAMTAANDSEGVDQISLKGPWSTAETDTEHFLRIEFATDTFTLHFRDGETELVESGMYQHDGDTIYLIVTHGNEQIQKELNYEVVDENTIHVTLNKEKYMMQRVP